MFDIFGLTFLQKESSEITEPKIWIYIEQRLQLKKEQKYAEADNIRKFLEEKGVILEDTKDGKTTWRWKS